MSRQTVYQICGSLLDGQVSAIASPRLFQSSLALAHNTIKAQRWFR